MAVTTKLKSIAHPKQLRLFNPLRDSAAVADLIESSFSSTLDPDGRRYLKQMRLGSQKKGIDRWAAILFKVDYRPLSGFVWEENGEIVGNLSLVPFYFRGHRINMIANVAVYPRYRRRGIASALTLAALEKSRKGMAKATWLQVRHDNLPAIKLYQQIGFVFKASRTTWIANPDSITGEAPVGTRVSIRKRRHWSQQQRWLEYNYPSLLRWYFLLRMPAMGPGILAAAYHFFNDLEIQHWSVMQENALLGVLSWQRSHRYADYLWLAAPPKHEQRVIETVLPVIRRLRWMDRPITLDYPHNRAVEVLTTVGFEPKVTLDWMEVVHNRNGVD